MPSSALGRAVAAATPRTRLLLLATLASLCSFPFVVLLVQIGGGPFRFAGVDFKAYYLAGSRVAAGLPLYADGPLVGLVPRPRATAFLYPPVVVLPFVGLATLSPVFARLCWLSIQLAFLWASLLFLARRFGLALSRRDAAVALLALVGFQPVFYLLRVGNVSGAMAGLLCLSAAVTVAPERDDRPYLGGALLAAGVLPKPFAAPAAAGLLGDRRRLAGAVAALLAFLAAGFLLFGPATHRAYLNVLLAGKGWGPAGDPSSLPVHFRPYYRFPAFAPILRGFLLGAAAGLALAATRVGSHARAFVVGTVTIPLVVPTANTLTLVLALPGILVALALEVREAGAPWLPLAALLSLQVSVPLSRTVTWLGPAELPGLPWRAVESVLVVQPATLGLLAVFWLCGYRVLVRAASDP